MLSTMVKHSTLLGLVIMLPLIPLLLLYYMSCLNKVPTSIGWWLPTRQILVLFMGHIQLKIHFEAWDWQHFSSIWCNFKHRPKISALIYIYSPAFQLMHLVGI